MKWSHLAGACAIGALLLTATTANAEVINPRRYRNAMVRVNCGERCWGTGFFVQNGNDPPVVATCYHVVEKRKKVTVTVRGPADSYYTVKSIMAYPESDLAFIKLNDVESWDPTVPWNTRAEVTDPEETPLLYYGMKRRIEVEAPFIQEAKYREWKRLALLGDSGLLPISPSSLKVFTFERAEAKPGDSGGPMFNDKGELIGLLAGNAIPLVGKGTTLFGVGLSVPIPAANANGWTSDQLTADSPYHSAKLDKLVATYTQEDDCYAQALSKQAASNTENMQCANALNELLGALQGRWNNLPSKDSEEFNKLKEKFGLSITSTCADRYQSIMPDLAVCERESDTQHQTAEAKAKAKADTNAVELGIARITSDLEQVKASRSKEEFSDAVTRFQKERPGNSSLDGLSTRLRETIARDKKERLEKITSLEQEKRSAEKKRATAEEVWRRADEVEKQSQTRADAAAKRALDIVLGSTP